MIRHAHPQDRPGVLATVVAAFVEDPGWAFILGEEMSGSRLSSWEPCLI
jgi:hypothetical protein